MTAAATTESLLLRAQQTPGYNPSALPIEMARQLIVESIKPLVEFETVALPDALGRVLAADIISPIDVPAHDNSAMDGYALRGADLHSDSPVVLSIVGTALAGDPQQHEVLAGQCLRIMTGAMMPAGCDTVVPQEHVHRLEGEQITLLPNVVGHGENRRLRGEDLRQGLPALPRGRRLRPSDLGLLASLGIGEVNALRKLRVAFFSTGDELRSLGEALSTGAVYDANRYTLLGMLARLGCEPIDLGLIKDDPASITAAFCEGSRRADMVITSGGVSVGEADHTKKVMANLGEVLFWTIAMRPGRPLAFGHIHDQDKRTPVFGLPGNPVAVMVTFYFLVRDALLRQMGEHGEVLPALRAISTHAIVKKPGRTEYQRARLSIDQSAQACVTVTGAQGSGILSSMSNSNCMMVLEHVRGNVAAGESVDVVIFDGLV